MSITTNTAAEAAASRRRAAAGDLDAARLGDYLARRIDGFEGPVRAEKFPGGQSNPTYKLTAASGAYVLRRKPPGAVLKSAHAVDREYRVLTALAQTDVPVAKALHLCEDEAVIGSMFYVMEYLDGDVHWAPDLPEHAPAERAQIYDALNRSLAAIHLVDVEAVGLGDFGRPGNYYERQIARWTRQYRAAETERIQSMELLIDWLEKNCIEGQARPALVHGDYRLDNVMFQKGGAKALAVMDWELSTLGDPVADLAYQCMQWRLEYNPLIKGLGDLDREALGIPSEKDYVAKYCARTGAGEIDNWEFYLAFSFFRLGAILQGILKRAIDGTAASEDAFKVGRMTRPLADQAVKVIENGA